MAQTSHRIHNVNALLMTRKIYWTFVCARPPRRLHHHHADSANHRRRNTTFWSSFSCHRYRVSRSSRLSWSHADVLSKQVAYILCYVSASLMELELDANRYSNMFFEPFPVLNSQHVSAQAAPATRLRQGDAAAKPVTAPAWRGALAARILPSSRTSSSASCPIRISARAWPSRRGQRLIRSRLPLPQRVNDFPFSSRTPQSFHSSVTLVAFESL